MANELVLEIKSEPNEWNSLFIIMHLFGTCITSHMVEVHQRLGVELLILPVHGNASVLPLGGFVTKIFFLVTSRQVAAKSALKPGWKRDLDVLQERQNPTAELPC